MGVTVIISGINDAVTPADVTPSGLLMMKFAMLVLPLLFILVGYLIYRYKYRIDSAMYERILADLQERETLSSVDRKILSRGAGTCFPVQKRRPC